MKLSRAPIGAVAVVLLLATACGTTALGSQGLKSPNAALGQDGLNAGLGIGGGTTAPPTSGSPLASGSPALGGFAGTVGPVAGNGLTVRGITATTIYVGASYQLDQSSTNGAIFGNDNFDTGDARNYYNVVIREINAHGGIAGRKIVPVYAELKTASTQTIDEQYQASCEKWIRGEHPVFAILDSGRPVVQECAHKAGIAEFGHTSSSVPETFRRYPNYVEISGVNLVRQGPVTVNGLAKQGYFHPGSRIGIVAWDDPYHREAVRQGYEPALKSLGLSLAIDTQYVRPPQSAQDLSGTSAQVSSAVLRFNTMNIDHVFVLDGTAGVCGGLCLTLLFLREAEAQRYHPWYGFNQENDPVAGLEGGYYPKNQLRKSLAVLWSDRTDDADAGIQRNAARERCLALMRKNGLNPNNVNAELAAFGACGELWFMQAAVTRMSGQLTVASFMTGVNRLGYSLNDPLVYGTLFSASQHDGVAAARNARYDEGCGCYSYTSVPYRV